MESIATDKGLLKKPSLVSMTAKTRTQAEAQAVALKTNPPYPPLSGVKRE